MPKTPDLPSTMRAAVYKTPGGPEIIEVLQRPVPMPGKGEILVRVRASALNRADLLQRAGRYPAPAGAPPDIPGLEFAGEVAALGDGATLWTIGDRVCGLVPGGAHAEFLVTHERAVTAVPLSLNWSIAGASPEAFVTAHDALVSQADLRPGETVLVHAAASGVGLAAIQLATALGARPYGTARGPDKLEAARAVGMIDGMMPTGSGSIAAAAREWTGGKGVDVVLDLVGGDYTAESVEALAPCGRLMLVGTLAGAEATINLRALLSHRLTIRGTVLRSRPIEERIAVTQAFGREVMPWQESGRLTPVIHDEFPLERIADAHRLLESNRTIGKVAIRVSESPSEYRLTDRSVGTVGQPDPLADLSWRELRDEMYDGR